MAVAPLTLVPNMCAKYIPFIANEYVSYAIGVSLYAALFAFGWIQNKAEKRVGVGA